MNIITRAKSAASVISTALACFLNPDIKQALQVQARYEAGRRWDPRRSYVPALIQDARYDADVMTRMEILRKARYFEQNNAIVNRLCDLFEQYTVGANGLRFVPASSDLKWNARARAFWNQWCKHPDVASTWNFQTEQSLIARSWFIDGEIFVLKTNGRVPGFQQSVPQIQLVETHRVQTPNHVFGDTTVFDGLKVDIRGKPLEYMIRTGGIEEENYLPYKANQIVHIGEPARPGMYRCLSMLYPVLNKLHDLDDLHMFQMDISKAAAEVTEVIKTKSGELSDEDFRRQRFKMAGSQGTSGGSDQERTQYYSDVFRGRAKVMKTGDEYQQLTVVRPSDSEFKYWDYLTSEICAGIGISKLLVFPWSMQGTVTRADLDVAATFFRSRSSVLSAGFEDIYLYVMEWATRNVISLSDPPSDWQNVTIRPPRSVNVDVGRNASALIAEYIAGFRTLENICAELGEDWEEILIERAVEFKRAAELEKQYGLKPGQLIEAALEAMKANQQQGQQQGSSQMANAA